MTNFESNTSHANGVVERWLAEIRKRAPEGSVVTATLQAKPQRGFLASFRLRTEEESLSSEARADNPDEAVAQAGKGLCQHLPGCGGQMDNGLGSIEESFIQAS